MEGDKIVKDILQNNQLIVNQLIATSSWLTQNQSLLSVNIKEITETDISLISKVSTLETPPSAMAVLDMVRNEFKPEDLEDTLTIALDMVQDPGNLGTIIRTADWFGIRNILCNEGCADVYNPKVIQASMGAVLRVKVHYLNLTEVIGRIKQNWVDFKVYGTFMQGTPVFNCEAVQCGIVLFGNESRGISAELLPFIDQHITIPPGDMGSAHVESLNVASSLAIVCALMTRK